MKHVAKLTALQTLKLSCCSNFDVGLKHLVGLQELENVFIEGGREAADMTDEGLATLSQLSRLKKLKLCDCPNITPNGFKLLQQLDCLDEVVLEHFYHEIFPHVHLCTAGKEDLMVQMLPNIKVLLCFNFHDHA